MGKSAKYKKEIDKDVDIEKEIESESKSEPKNTLSYSGKLPKAKKTCKVNLGKEGLYDVVSGKALPSEINQRFYSSLEADGII